MATMLDSVWNEIDFRAIEPAENGPPSVGFQPQKRLSTAN